MSDPYFTLLWARSVVEPDGRTVLHWNAEFFDSTGFRHWTDLGYRLAEPVDGDPEPNAASVAFATAKDVDGWKAAILLDAQRCLTEFEARLTAQDGPQEIAFADNEKTFNAAGNAIVAPAILDPIA